VRTAIGAAWPRLLRQLVTESCVVAAIAAALGVGLASAGLEVLLRASPVAFPSFVHPHVDMRSAAFTIALSSSSASCSASRLRCTAAGRASLMR
jgi:hypothetical protein